MKKLMILLSLLPACLVPGKAQNLWGFSSGAEYAEYVETLQQRRALLTDQQQEDVARRSERVEQLRKEAAAETDPQKRQALEDRIFGESRMIGEVGSRYLDEFYKIDQELEGLQRNYEFVFPEAFPYYRDREKYSKAELQDALKKASRTIRRSPTGKALKQYIKTLP